MSQRTAILLVILVALFGVYYLFGSDSASIDSLLGAGTNADAGTGTGMKKVVLEVWPPVLGQPYPDLDLLDRDGKPVRLSKWRGKVILLEPVGMDCPACQGFAGGNDVGALGKVSVQESAPAVEKLLAGWGRGARLSDPGLVYVQLLLYDLRRGPPTPADAALWDDHFDIGGRHGHVLVPEGDMRNRASYDLIPGFQLIDRDFVLRWDASGHRPTHGYDQLMAAISDLI